MTVARRLRRSRSTVAAYLQTAHSVEAAARRLFVHPNTVRYRLQRAAQACGRRAADARDAQVLQVALALGRRADIRSRS
jgi:DNA-binding PucR family transcriptional regulator